MKKTTKLIFLVIASLVLSVVSSNSVYASETDKRFLPEIESLYYTSVDVDGYYGGQCWDLTNFYLMKQGSKGIWGGSGRAGTMGEEFGSQLTAEGFTVILNPEISQIQPGDVVNIRPYRAFTEFHGHTAIIKSVNSDGTFTTIEQNAEMGQIVAEYVRTYQKEDLESIISKKFPEPVKEVKKEEVKKEEVKKVDIKQKKIEEDRIKRLMEASLI